MIPLPQQLSYLSRAIRTARTPEDREAIESIREVVQMRQYCAEATEEMRRDEKHSVKPSEVKK